MSEMTVFGWPYRTDEQWRRDRVEAAAAWMDVRHPGWAERIDPLTLDVYQPDRCVGAQVGVDWQELGRGFEEDTGRSPVGIWASPELTPLWAEEARRRCLPQLPAPPRPDAVPVTV